MDFVEARKLFPGLNNKVFLDAACVSLIPITAKKEIHKFLDMALECPSRDASLHHIEMDIWRRNTCVEAAKLFNVHIDRVALIESTTQGLNIAVNSIPFRKEDEVIIIDTEFLQVAIPFMKKEEEEKLTVVPAKVEDEFVDLKIIESKITEKTKAICISSVQWCNGYRFPMAELGKICQEKGIWLIVDGVHEAGVLNIDLASRHCDFFVTGGHKWLNAPYGCGVMVLSDKALELSPPGYGYLALEEPTGGWGAFFQDPSQSPYRDYKYQPTAKKFEIAGTGNYPGAIGLAESMKIINTLRIKKVEERVLELSRFLKNELHKLDAKIISSQDTETQSSITVFQLFDDPSKDLALLERLLDERILVSIRYTSNKGGIRVSTHYYNNEDDILNLCNAIKRLTYR